MSKSLIAKIFSSEEGHSPFRRLGLPIIAMVVVFAIAYWFST